ncbi:uncharacterized protein LOC133824263 [Humulus lupulus]|uniref:uncharacterized protein LOC133824263 n=1 Tax=Humulus lupulus TaxID=3486 RepID=UPI002B40BF72|nr:uncharacterized protein LOC133824263 [Humulus lupulus]
MGEVGLLHSAIEDMKEPWMGNMKSLMLINIQRNFRVLTLMNLMKRNMKKSLTTWIMKVIWRTKNERWLSFQIQRMILLRRAKTKFSVTEKGKGKQTGSSRRENDEDFILEEEEFEQDVEAEKEMDGICSEEELHELKLEDEFDAGKNSKEFNLKTKMQNFQFVLGMEFSTVTILRNAIREYIIEGDREYVFISNDSNRIRVKCKGANYEWMLFASIVNKTEGKTMRVKTLVDKHSCGSVLDNKKLTSTWLAKHFWEQFRLNPSMEYTAFREITAKTKYSRVSSWTFYRAKTKARKMLEGSVKEQYAILDDYCKRLLDTNPGSTVKLKTDLVNGRRTF